MSKFQLDADLVSDNHKTREAAVAVQTRRYQRRALAKKHKRTAKYFRSFHSRATRYSISA